MNRGYIPGVNADGWREYVPQLKVGAAAQAITQPDLGSGAIQRGRYLVTRAGFVIVQAFIRWGTSPSQGTGDAYMVSLPVRGNRWTKSGALPNGADLPIGSGMVTQGITLDPAYSMPVIPTLTDPWNVNDYTNEEDAWAQMFIQGNIAQGTATIAASGTSVTVTHGLQNTPRAGDIRVTPINTPSGSSWQIYAVQNITPTTFDIVTKASVGTGGQDFAYQIIATPWTGATSFTGGSRTTNVVTLTGVTFGHGIGAGSSITVSATDTSYNGTFTVTSSTSSTVTYSQTAADDASSGSGTIYRGSGAVNVPMLAAPGRPWVWAATHEISLELFYEAA